MYAIAASKHRTHRRRNHVDNNVDATGAPSASPTIKLNTKSGCFGDLGSTCKRLLKHGVWHKGRDRWLTKVQQENNSTKPTEIL